MSIAGILLIGIGCIVIIIGLIFIVPYKNVRQFSNNKVEGQIVDMVWNASVYNRPLDEAANVEHLKVAGIKMEPGIRSSGLHIGETMVRVGDNSEADPNRVVYGRGEVNMYHKVYRYEVNGKEYSRADGVRYNKGRVEQWIGKTVPVYYNPENPQQSTLSNGGGYKLVMIILYIVGGLFVLTGIGMIVLDVLLVSLIW